MTPIATRLMGEVHRIVEGIFDTFNWIMIIYYSLEDSVDLQLVREDVYRYPLYRDIINSSTTPF